MWNLQEQDIWTNYIKYCEATQLKIAISVSALVLGSFVSNNFSASVISITS